jgi:hypothetical protein
MKEMLASFKVLPTALDELREAQRASVMVTDGKKLLFKSSEIL